MSRTIPLVFLICLFTGCASVPKASIQASNQAKEFNSPTEGHAGLYIYRDSALGAALKKDIWVDGICVGESASNIFFYQEVKGDMEHKISTESEFSPNDLVINTRSGNNYFIEQYIKIGIFVGGANLKLVDPDKGQKDISSLELAAKGTCSTQYKPG